MTLPAVSTPLACPRCASTQVRLEPSAGGSLVYAFCDHGHRFVHPDQAFARDLQRGRERIVVGRRR